MAVFAVAAAGITASNWPASPWHAHRRCHAAESCAAGRGASGGFAGRVGSFRVPRIRFAGPETVVGPNHLPRRSKRRLDRVGIQGGAILVGGWIVGVYGRRHLLGLVPHEGPFEKRLVAEILPQALSDGKVAGGSFPHGIQTIPHDLSECGRDKGFLQEVHAARKSNPRPTTPPG